MLLFQGMDLTDINLLFDILNFLTLRLFIFMLFFGFNLGVHSDLSAQVINDYFLPHNYSVSLSYFIFKPLDQGHLLLRLGL